MLILCNYDACYHSFYEFSPLVCHSTKVQVYALFWVNYVLYECLIFYKVKYIEINYLTLIFVDDLKD